MSQQQRGCGGLRENRGMGSAGPRVDNLLVDVESDDQKTLAPQVWASSLLMKIASYGSLKMHGVRPQVQTASPGNCLFYEGQKIAVAVMQEPFSQLHHLF